MEALTKEISVLTAVPFTSEPAKPVRVTESRANAAVLHSQWAEIPARAERLDLGSNAPPTLTQRFCTSVAANHAGEPGMRAHEAPFELRTRSHGTS